MAKKFKSKEDLGEHLFLEDFAPKKVSDKKRRKAEKIVFGDVYNAPKLPEKRKDLIDHYETVIREIWNQQYESNNFYADAHEEAMREMYAHIGEFYVQRQDMWNRAEKDAEYNSKLIMALQDAYDSAGEPIYIPNRGE